MEVPHLNGGVRPVLDQTCAIRDVLIVSVNSEGLRWVDESESNAKSIELN